MLMIAITIKRMYNISNDTNFSGCPVKVIVAARTAY